MWVFAAAASAAAASPAPMQIDVLPGDTQQFEITATNDGVSTQQFEARAYWRQNAFVANVDIGREYTFSSLDTRPVPVSPSAALVMVMLMMVAGAFTSTRRAHRQH